MDLYSVVCVRDRVASRKWFEVFFGRPADEVIGDEYLWQVGENAWVVIDDRAMRAARVGGTMITFGAPSGAFTSNRGGAFASRASSVVMVGGRGSGIGKTVRSIC